MYLGLMYLLIFSRILQLKLNLYALAQRIGHSLDKQVVAAHWIRPDL